MLITNRDQFKTNIQWEKKKQFNVTNSETKRKSSAAYKCITTSCNISSYF